MQVDGKKVKSKILHLEEEWGESELGDYPHFMLKESRTIAIVAALYFG